MERAGEVMVGTEPAALLCLVRSAAPTRLCSPCGLRVCTGALWPPELVTLATTCWLWAMG